jgi:hypothetical protein
LNKKNFLEKTLTLTIIISLILCFFIPLISISPVVAKEYEVNLDCIADAYVKGDSATTNYNTGELFIRANPFGTGDIRRSYLDFDFESLPAGVTITKVILHIYQTYGDAAADTMALFRVTSTWAEDTITWNTQPSSTTSKTEGINGTAGWKEYDVTTLLSDLDGLYGLMLKVNGENQSPAQYWIFSSSETASYEPYITVTYNYYATPTVELSLPSGAFFGETFLVNVTTDCSSAVEDLKQVKVDFDTYVTLLWEQSTNTFSESYDPNGWCTLGTSSKIQLNTTAVFLSFELTLSEDYIETEVDVTATSYNDKDKTGDDTGQFTLYELSQTADVVLQFSFDNETSSTNTYDLSGYENTGTLYSTTRTYEGYYGMGLIFNGLSYVEVSDSDELDYATSVSLSAQIKPSTITESIIFDKPDAYGLYLRSDGGLTLMLNNLFFNTTDSDLIEVDKWYHIVTEYDRSIDSVVIIINSEIEESFTYSDVIYPTAYDLVIGDKFIGTLDEIMIANETSTKFFSPIATYPYVYGGFVDTTACSWIVSSMNYNFTGSYIRQNSTYPITYAGFNFTDGTDELGVFYDVQTSTWEKLIGTTEKISVQYSSVTTTGNALSIYVNLKIEETIQTQANVDLYLYCETADSEDELLIEDRFNIYGLGGYISPTLIGDGFLIAGGSPLDVAATNSSETETGSSARVDMVTPNFQHVHFMTHIYQGTYWDGANWNEPTFEHGTAYMAFGVDYMIENCTWQNGWYVNITIIDGAANANNAWVQLKCDWYSNQTLVKTNYIYAMYEANIEASNSTTQFTLYIDLWISSDMGNSMVGGHVSSRYHGIHNTGWWLWSSWAPINGLATSTTFYDYLYDVDGNITTASTLKIFRVWNEINKDNAGTGDSDECVYAIMNEVLQVSQIPFYAELEGIISPVFTATTTPDMPMGFFASIGNYLGNAIDTLKNAIVNALGGFVDMSAGALDTVFTQFGITNFTTSVTSVIATIGTYFSNSVTYVTGMIVAVFTLLSSIGITAISWFGGFIDTLIQIGTVASSILSGELGLLDAFSLSVVTESFGVIGGMITSGAFFIFIFIWWADSIDKRAKQYGGGWMSFFMSDIQSIIAVFSFVIDMVWRVVTTVIDFGIRFIGWFI